MYRWQQNHPLAFTPSTLLLRGRWMSHEVILLTRAASASAQQPLARTRGGGSGLAWRGPAPLAQPARCGPRRAGSERDMACSPAAAQSPVQLARELLGIPIPVPGP